MKSSNDTSRPARQECVLTKFMEQRKLNVQAFNGFPCTAKLGKNNLSLLPKIQDVSRHPDTVAAVKIYSYVTAYGIFQHRHSMHLSLAG